MTVGLPGTGIGGIFYLVLAVCMPVMEFIRTLKGRTTFKRWFLVALQLFFVIGVISAMWGEIWLMNKSLAWLWGTLKVNGPLIMKDNAFQQTKIMAIASASASFISLALVISSVHVLRFFVHLANRRKHSVVLKIRPAFQLLNQPAFKTGVSQWNTSSVLNKPSAAAC